MPCFCPVTAHYITAPLVNALIASYINIRLNIHAKQLSSQVSPNTVTPHRIKDFTLMLLSFAMVALGLTLLALGGDVLVRSSVSIARTVRMSTFLTGVLVVGFGTSAPELLVSLDAAYRGKPDIAVGNVVGSNIANILLILGLAAFIAPIACSARVIKRDILVTLAASFILLGLGLTGQITRPAGLLMLAIMAGYIIFIISHDGAQDPGQGRAQNRIDLHDDDQSQSRLLRAVVMFVISVVMLAVGADWLVEGAATIARTMGVSEAIIGLSLVAIGTSLPELAAAVMAATRRQTDLIIGNVLGSSLFNILVILGLTALITPLPVAPRMATTDLPISIVVLVLLGLLVRLTPRLTRRHGIAFTALYAGYSVLLLA